MYVMRYGNDRTELVEMTTAQFARDQDKQTLIVVSAQYAHRWVKRGELHSTPLYVDDTGRVRRASAGC